jgi:glutamate formiminotransferase
MTLIIPESQSVQAAINACNHAHTGIHQALERLKIGSTREAKYLIARQIAALATALMVL